MTIDRPIILLGPTRSGKSLVGQLLSKMPGFALAFEPVTVWNYGMRRGEDDVRTVEEATPRVIAHCRRRIEQFLARSGGKRYVDDLPHHTLRVAFCRAVLPEARFIVVVRDPAEAILRMIGCWRAKDTVGRVLSRRVAGGRYRSIQLTALPRHGWRWLNNTLRTRLGLRKGAWGPTVPGQREFARTHPLHETVAFQWASLARSTVEAIEKLPSDRVLQVRYEDLVSPTWRHRELDRIASFCEVDCISTLQGAADDILNPRWPRSSLTYTTAQWQAICLIAGEAAERLGYTLAPPDHIASDVASERFDR